MNPNNYNKILSMQASQADSNNFSGLLNDYITKNPKEGFLKFQVTTGVIPVKDAEIVISKNIGGDVYIGKTLKTDGDGKTEAVSLPTPEKALSMVPGNMAPYSSYDIRVSKEGYLDSIFYDVPVFEGITSIQAVDLKPDLGASNIKNNTPVYERSYNNL